MPTPGQMNSHQFTGEQLDVLKGMEQRGNHGGAIRGAGMPAAMTQAESVLAARVESLCEEIRELRRMLAPPSAVILTGAEVLRHFDSLRTGEPKV